MKREFWNKMEILRSSKQFANAQKKKSNSKELFISLDKPTFFTNNYEYVVKTSSKDICDEKELSVFYCSNFRIGKSNNTILVSLYDIKKFLSISAEILTIRIEEKLIGSMISFILPLQINLDINKQHKETRYNYMKNNKDDNIFACASYLILDKSFRGKGMGMALIQESLQLFHEYGGLGSYFINAVSRCDNSIQISNWYFPLNLDKLDKCKFLYPKDYRKLFEIEGKEMSEKVDENNIKEAHNYYMNYVKDKKVYFSPSLEYYSKWILLFPTYIVRDNNEIVGLFSFFERKSWYPTLNSVITSGQCITCIGIDIDLIMKQSILEGKKHFDILCFYQLGDVKAENLSKIFAQKDCRSYINFFNTTLKVNASDFYSPPF